MRLILLLKAGTRFLIRVFEKVALLKVCEAEDHFVVTDNNIAVLKERGIIA